MLVDCPAALKNRQCLLRFVRNANDLKTKLSAIDNGGFAEFNEKIEMKTFIEYDQNTGSFKKKMAQLQAVTDDGQTLGSTDIDLADYAQPEKYHKQLTLSDTTNNVSERSFITVEIRTFDANKPQDSSPNKKQSSRSTLMNQPATQKNKQLNLL